MSISTGKKDGFRSRVGFVLACVGSAVGMGNIWRFPIMVSQFGGLTFLIPYFIFVILIGNTGVIEEMAFGRATGCGPIGAFGAVTRMRGKGKRPGEILGMLPVAGSLAMAIGYSCIMGWIIKYTFMAVSGGLHKMGTDMDIIGGTFGETASAWGANIWIILALAVSFSIMALGVAGGIEIANRIMMPILFGLLLILAVYISFLPGASEGYKYIFTLDPAGLLNPHVLVFAFGQAFFSLSIAGNGTVIYGSYLPHGEDIPVSARRVALFDTIAALLAAFVIIPAMAAGNGPLDSGGPGLMFIYLVNVMNGMPGGRIVGMIFFICVFFAGISSIVNLYEAPVATLQQQLGLNRHMAVGIIGAVGCLTALCIQEIVSPWMDVVSIYICPLGAALAGFMFFVVAGKDFVYKAVNEGAKKPVGGWFYPLGLVFIALAVLALILGAVFGGIG